MSKHLEITTYIGCPNMCSYCPQRLLINTYEGQTRMTPREFERMLNNVPEDVDIHFSGFSELFFHKDAMEFIRLAKLKHEVVVYTTTNGIKEEYLKELGSIKFKQFVLHEIKGMKYPELSFATSSNKVENPVSRASANFDAGEHSGHCTKQGLEEQFTQNVVLPNGDVYLCCCDYGLKHKIGNLFETNFNNMVRAEKYELCKNCEFYA